MPHYYTLFLTASAMLALMAGPAHAGSTSAQGDWIKKGYDISGSWQIVTAGGHRYLELSEDFETRRGPDLKLFLSPTPFARVKGSTATDGSITVSRLKKNRGSQRYLIPDGVDLSDYKSVLIHCERFSKLWGGAPL